MKTKNISLAIVSMFALVFFLAFASASFSLTPITPVTQVITAGDTTSLTFEFNVSASGSNYTSFGLVPTTVTAGGQWSLTGQSALNAGDTKTFNAKLTFQGINTVPYSGQSIITLINISGITTTGVTEYQSISPVTITVSPIVAGLDECPSGSNSSNLDLSVDIKNKGTGDDNSWNLLDTVEVKVKFENNLDSDGQDIDNLDDGALTLALYKDGSTSDSADDLIWLGSDSSGEYDFGSVNEGDKVEHTFTFRVNPAEFDEGTYYLKVMASGKDDNNGEHCVAYSSDFSPSVYESKIRINQPSSSKAVVVDVANPTFEDLTASCEQKVTFTADVWNLGTNDYSDQIMVTLFNSDLGINQSQVITGDLDSQDKTQATFSFTIPKGMDEGAYNLIMNTYYDWDSDNSRYNRVSEDNYVLPLDLEGNCILPEATITAALQEGTETKAGKPLFVVATITNTAAIDSTYTFSLGNYTSWASDATINNSLTLAAGESGTVLISLDVNRKASGDQSFNIIATSDGETFTQPAQVSIEGRKGLDFLGNNGAVAALIALITAIAIAVIIVLIVKASNKKKE